MKTVKRSALTLLSVLLVVGGLAACSSTQTTGEQVDDAGITARVKARLAADPDVNPFEIDVDTTDMVVTLRGYVDDPEDRGMAERIARDTDGVTRVVNRIEIGEAPDMNEGDELPDAAVVAAVGAAFAASDLVGARDIDVDANEGHVTLSGTVASAAERDEAIRLARGAHGVVRVTSELEIQ